MNARGETTKRSTLAKKKLPDDENIGERVYRALREQVIAFEIRPGEKVNEITLAKRLGVSRTPVREALFRLCTEGFLTSSSNQGFFRKVLDVKEVFDLYEFRQKLEAASLRLAGERATTEQIAQIEQFLEGTSDEDPGRTTLAMVMLDEQFHEKVMALSGNSEMLYTLRNINVRIRYVRWIDMEAPRWCNTQRRHREIIDKLRERDIEASVQLMSNHIARRFDQITEKVERCYGKIYVSPRQDATPALEQSRV